MFKFIPFIFNTLEFENFFNIAIGPGMTYGYGDTLYIFQPIYETIFGMLINLHIKT